MTTETRQTITTEHGQAALEEDVVYGRTSQGEEGHDLQCDIYSPLQGATHAPCIIQIHGGGWRQGARNMPGMLASGVLLSQRGYVCVSITYRLTPEAPWPAQLHDAKTALRWVRANAARLGIDTNRIAILGKSAGAHIALMLAATMDDPAHEGNGGSPGAGTSFNAVAVYYPPTRINRGAIAASDAIKALMGPNHNPEALAEASPLTHVPRVTFPPTLLIHGNADVVVSPGDSTALYEALVGAGVPVELHMYAGLPHGFDNGVPAFQRQCSESIDLFLNRYMARILTTS